MPQRIGSAFSDPEVHGEVQAVNLHLMDQGLRFGYKEVAVLFGDRPSSFSRFAARRKAAGTTCLSPEQAQNFRDVVVPSL